MPATQIPETHQAVTLLYVTDVDTFFARATAAGTTETMAVADTFDGDRRGTLTDPFGHVWLLATKREEITSEELRSRFSKMMDQGEQPPSTPAPAR